MDKTISLLVSTILVIIPIILFFKYYHNSKRGGWYHATCFFLTVLFGPLGFIWVLIMREYPEAPKPIQQSHENAYKSYVNHMEKQEQHEPAPVYQPTDNYKPFKVTTPHENFNYRNFEGCSFSEKFDGVRGIWNGVDLRTKTGKIINAPAWFIESLPLNKYIDGELFMGYNTLEKIAGLIRTKTPVDTTWACVVFKVVETNANISELPIYCETVRTLTGCVESALDMITARGGEGVVVDYKGAKVKYKRYTDSEYIVTSYCDGVSLVSDGVVSFSLRTPSNVKNGDCITIKYSGKTINNIPRCPTFVGVRDYE